MIARVRSFPPPIAGTAVETDLPGRGRRALVLVRLAPDGRPPAINDRLIEAVRSRVLEVIAVDDEAEPVLFLDDGIAVVASITPDQTPEELSERVRRAVSGRVRATTRTVSMDITVVPRLDVARIADAPPDAAPAHRDALRRAIGDHTIAIRYAPVVHAAHEDLRGIVATTTWDHPVHGRVSDRDLRDAARGIAEIEALDRRIVSQSCADLGRFVRSRRAPGRPAVHVPVDDTTIADRRYVHLVVELIRRHRHHPAQVVLMVEGTGFVTGRHEVVDGVRAMRRIGVRVSVDTIGTADAGLATLTSPGADVVRIGAPLLGRRLGDGDLPSALVHLAHATGAEAMGTGIDQLAGLRRARAVGIDLVHGAAIGPPAEIVTASS